MPVYDKPVTSGINNGGITDLGNGMMIYVGTGLFTTTGETVIVYHPFGKGDVFHASAAVLGGSTIDAQDAPLAFEVGATAGLMARDTTYGSLKSVTPGQSQVRRQAAGSSAMAFSILMIGRSRH